MTRYLDLHNGANVDHPMEFFDFEPLPTLSWKSQNINSSISSGSTPQALILLFIIGIFLLLQACFNYVNISLSSGSRRFKEIGIRIMKNKTWGSGKKRFTSFLLSMQFEILKNEMDLNPNIFQVAGTRHLVGRSQGQAVVEVQAKKHEVVRFDVGYDYLESLKIRLKEGRLFDSLLSTDLNSAVVVNEKFVQNMGWSSALDQLVRFENKNYHVIGVVEDFHYQFYFEEIEPVLLRIVEEDVYKYLSVRVNENTRKQSAEFLQGLWHRMYPDSAYDVFYQDSVFIQGYRNNQIITKIFDLTAGITLVISCMGLFGLVTLIISKRKKELSIHKVLGASTIQISQLISRRFLVLLGSAILLGLPLGYFGLKNLLDGIYKYHKPFGVGPFIYSGGIVLLTAFLTVSTQVFKAAVKDPIEALRYE